MKFFDLLQRLKFSPPPANMATRWKRPGPFLFAAGGVFLLSLLSGVYLFFPVEVLTQRIIQEVGGRTGSQVEVDSVSLFPLLTLDAENLSIRGKDFPVPLEIQQLSLSPDWMSLFSKDPGVDVETHLMGGEVTSAVRKSGAFNARASELHFELPVQGPFPLTVSGTLEQGDFNGSTRLKADTLTTVSLSLSQVRVLGLSTLGVGEKGISLGTIGLVLEGQGRSIKIKSLTASGGEFAVKGSGTLLIGRTVATSHVNLSFQITPMSGADPTLASLLELSGKPDTNGSFSLMLLGSLDKPLLK